jgi:hypothetical protein
MAARIIEIRLRQAQIRLRLTTPIFDLPRSETHICKQLMRGNWALHTLIIAKLMKIDIALDPRDKEAWHITEGVTTIRQALTEQNCIYLLLKIPNSPHFPLFFVDQLVWSHYGLITWTQYKV